MTDFPIIPRLRIIKKLGSGGVADVYLAVQEPLNREVAVKVLVPALFRDAQLPRRFLKEAETAAKLRHPHIVTVHDVGQAGETYYIVMEYLQESLRDRIKRGALVPDEALSVLRQVGGALGYAHDRGFIHRDVKPENIMFREDGTAVLVDFGIVRAVGGETRLTATGFSVGTPHYMSPEQIRDKGLDGRADIYSLGVVFYEMLTGNVPFEGQDTIAIAMKHVQEPVPRLPEHLRLFQPLLERMMAKEREERVQSGEELVRLVADYESSIGQHGASIEMRQAHQDYISSGLKAPVQARPAGVKKPGRAGRARLANKPNKRAVKDLTVSNRNPARSKNIIIGVLLGVLVVAIGLVLVLVSKRSPEGSMTLSVPSDIRTWTEPVTGMEFVWIPAGEFDMGSNNGDSDEKPVHRVYVDGFWMGKHEVTQGEWRAVMGANPSHFKKGDNYPVEQVSWDDAQEFVRRLNSRTGQTVRLPTEAEWEHACRAGTTGDRYGNLDDIAWYSNNSGSSTHQVGQKRANSFGLYDMLGNVWEWCQDWYGSYSSGYVRNPSGPSSGSYRVNRGGSWYFGAQYVRSALRFDYTPSTGDYVLGFRLARTK